MSKQADIPRPILFRFFLYSFLGGLFAVVFFGLGLVLFVISGEHSPPWVFLPLVIGYGLVAALLFFRPLSFLDYCRFLERRFPQLGTRLTTLQTAPFTHPIALIFRKRIFGELMEQFPKLPFSFAWLQPLFWYTGRAALLLLLAWFSLRLTSGERASRRGNAGLDLRVLAKVPAYLGGSEQVLKPGEAHLPEGTAIVLQRVSSVPIEVSGATLKPIFLRESFSFLLRQKLFLKTRSAAGVRRFILGVQADHPPQLVVPQSPLRFAVNRSVSLPLLALDDHGLAEIVVEARGKRQVIHPKGKEFGTELYFSPGAQPLVVTFSVRDTCPFRKQQVQQRVQLLPLAVSREELSPLAKTKKRESGGGKGGLAEAKALGVANTQAFLQTMDALLKRGVWPRPLKTSWQQLLPYLSAEGRELLQQIQSLAAKVPLPKEMQRDFLFEREHWEEELRRQAVWTEALQKLLRSKRALELAQKLVAKENLLVKDFSSKEWEKLSPLSKRGRLSYHLFQQKKAQELVNAMPPQGGKIGKVKEKLKEVQAALRKEDVAASKEATGKLLAAAQELEEELKALFQAHWKEHQQELQKEWERVSGELLDVAKAGRKLKKELEDASTLPELKRKDVMSQQELLKGQVKRLRSDLGALYFKSLRFNAPAQSLGEAMSQEAKRAQEALAQGNLPSAKKSQRAFLSAGNLLGLDLLKLQEDLSKEKAGDLASRAEQFLEAMLRQSLEALKMAQKGVPVPEGAQPFLYGLKRDAAWRKLEKEFAKAAKKWSKLGGQGSGKEEGQKKTQSKGARAEEKRALLREYLRLYYALKAQGVEAKRESQPGKAFRPSSPPPLRLPKAFQQAPLSPLETKHERALKHYFQMLPSLGPW